MFSTPIKDTSFRQGIKRIQDEPDLIEMVNKLQNKLAASGKMLDISLPQIVIEGCQSGGKSSVVEAIIGREFLPRGTGTVTRRPTVIQLQPNDEVYAEFAHKPNCKYTDFEEVKEEIIDETVRECGPTGFSSKPIFVKIFAPDVLKLTLVDMPGIIKNVVGDLTEESIADVKSMILKYIEQPNSIILAISPANQDIATSDALEMAKMVDPNRERTLGVLTKLDLMDSGTHACDILENRTLPLARGYVGVVNRSQSDIDEGKDIQYSLAKEKRFFENHPAYSYLADRMGSLYLQKLLNSQLREHIKKTLPVVRKELQHKLNSIRKELKEFDEMLGMKKDGTNEIKAFMFKLVQLFIDNLHVKLYGHSEDVEVEILEAGALINCKLYTDLEQILKLPKNLTEEKLMKLIANQHGIRNILSVPALSLEAACASILKSYKDPLECFVDSIADLLITAVNDSSLLISAYPSLKAEVMSNINDSIDNATEDTKDLIGKHLMAEKMFCNIYHWDFNSVKLENGLCCSPVKLWNSCEEVLPDRVSSSHANPLEFETVSSDIITEKMKENVNAKANSRNLANVIEEYMHLVQKQVADVTVKYVICFLVKAVSEFIKNDLTLKLMVSPNLKSLVEECEAVFEVRENYLSTCADLEEALNAVYSF